MNEKMVKWLFVGLFLLGAVGHFVQPEFFLRIIPEFVPYKTELVLLSGIAEAIAALLLVYKGTARLGALLILLMLLAYVPLHVYMAVKGFPADMPPVAAWLRLVFQFMLIYWVATLRAKLA